MEATGIDKCQCRRKGVAGVMLCRMKTESPPESIRGAWFPVWRKVAQDMAIFSDSTQALMRLEVRLLSLSLSRGRPTKTPSSMAVDAWKS